MATKRTMVTVEDDRMSVTAVKTLWSEDEANALLAKGWILLHGGIAHRDAGGFQAKPVFILGNVKGTK